MSSCWRQTPRRVQFAGASDSVLRPTDACSSLIVSVYASVLARFVRNLSMDQLNSMKSRGVRGEGSGCTAIYAYGARSKVSGAELFKKRSVQAVQAAFTWPSGEGSMPETAKLYLVDWMYARCWSATEGTMGVAVKTEQE